IAQLAAAVRDELAPLAQRKQVALRFELQPDLVANGDAFLLQRALANLVRNAIDFAPAGSAIDLAAFETHNRIELRVRDRGPGLPEYARSRAFEKFFSLPRPDTGRKGTGLGLAFVKEVAQLHGGAVRLANHAEGGALATLTLPRAAPAR
ncbi:MAG: ATP-binding protein, partial [Pseudomonadota bacterium]